MEKIRDALDKYEDSGGELYYTDKQKRVLKTIVENPDASPSEIATQAGCHQSYVSYVLENASPEVIRELKERIRAREAGEEEEPEIEGSAVLESFGGEAKGTAEAAEAATKTTAVNAAESVETISPFTPEGELREDVQVESVEKEDGEVVYTLVQNVPVRFQFSLPKEASGENLLSKNPSAEANNTE